MSTEQVFIDFIMEQLDALDGLAVRKMFGEAALYYQGKVVADICDNQLFIKPTEAGRTFIGSVTEAPPYPGAKDYFLIDDRLDDRAWLCRLVTITADALPMPKVKKAKHA